jgi:hypothetical protein
VSASANVAAAAPSSSRAGWVAGAAPAALIACIAAAQGGYFPTAWGWISLALVWVLAAAIVAGVPRLGREEAMWMLALAAFVVWVALSAVWSQDVPQTVQEVLRDLTVPLAVGAILMALPPLRAPHFVAGLFAGTVLICAYGTLTRVLPDRIGTFDPIAGVRLTAPLGYWNALGLFAASSLLLGIAVARSFGPRSWPLIAPAAVVIATTMYFTFSRGAWAALVLGLAVAAAADPRRAELLATTLVFTPTAAIAVGSAATKDALTHRGIPAELAARAGHRLGAELILLMVIAAVVATGAARIARRAGIPSGGRQLVDRGLVVVAALVVVGGVAAEGGPTRVVQRAYDAFVVAPPPQDDLNSRLFTLSGSWRADFWRVAWDDVREHPLLGSGAGTFERRWLAERPRTMPVRDAHSLYLETLAETGPLGLALLLYALAVPLALLVRARGAPFVPCCIGVYVAFLGHAAVDWDWEVPAVVLLAAACAAAGAVAARPTVRTAVRIRPRVLVAALALVGVVAFVGLVGNIQLARSSTAAARGSTVTAAAAAHTATRWAPWSARAWRLLGEARLAQGRFAEARAAFRRAIDRDPGDWKSWLDLGHATTGSAQQAALERVSVLNPRSPEAREFRQELAAGWQLQDEIHA